MREYSGLLQTDAAINQGNSGGALLDITGRLIGINNAMAMGAENIGFAIPVDTMREVFETQLLSSDSLTNAGDAPWLGMDVAENGGAIVVNKVVRGGPAATAGIRIGDVIEIASGENVRTRLDFTRRLLRADQDKPFALRLRRERETLDLSPQPWSRAEGGVLAMTGLVLEEVRPTQDRQLVETVTRTFWRGKRAFRVPLFAAALRVVEVQEGSPAAALRVAPGDVLMAAELPSRFGGSGEEPLESRRTLASWLQQLQGRTIRLVVLRGNEDLAGTLDVRAVESDGTR